MRLFSKKKSMTHKIYCAKNIPCDDENCILDTHLCTCDTSKVEYDTFIRSALNAGFTDDQVNWLEKYVYDSQSK
jgi:hypothetical protein